MANYETMFVLSVANGEEATAAMVEKVKALVSANGTLDSVDEWGKRKLAYAIDYISEGYYVLVNFKANAELPAELERNFRINDNVMRYMVIKKA